MDLSSFKPEVGSRSLRVRSALSCGLLLLSACSARQLAGTDGGANGDGDGDLDGDPPGFVCTDEPGDGDGDGNHGPGCEDYTVDFDNAIANVLVVLDRSGSMRDLTANRWDPSVSAVEDLSKSAPASLRLGLMTFPGDCGAYPTAAEQQDCLLRQSGSALGQYTCEPGQVKVMPGASTSTAISEQLHAMAPAGATPTASTLKNAHETLMGMASPQSTQTVLLVTDGAPNCASGDAGGLGSVGVGLGTASTGQAAAIPQTVAQIDAMTKDGIKTYVLGYDTQSDPTLAGALDMMAKAGGTGASQHQAVGDHDTLLKALEALAGRTASCELALKSTVVDPWKVQVSLDNTVLNVNDPNGYALDAAGDNLTLLGTACATAQAGTGHALRVKAVCPPPPPAPPVTPPTPPTTVGDGDGDDDEGQDEEPLDLKRRKRVCVPIETPREDGGLLIDLL